MAMLTATLLLILLLGCLLTSAQTSDEKEIAARYAPVFHQALGGHPRGDYITNFDFDGDWDGTNNWADAEEKRFQLRAYIYYSVVETATHYFIHYADFHARDYKGGEHKGVMYSDLLRIGARVLSKGSEPSGKLAEAAIAHENDMEGTLVVVEKSTGRIAFLETLHHNRFSTYSPEDPSLSLSSGSAGLPFKSGVAAGVDGRFKTLGSHVELYVEPKGHGIQAWGTEADKPELGFLVYKYIGRAEDPENVPDAEVGYDLLPIGPTLWDKAKAASPKEGTFAGFKDYGTITIDLISGPRRIALGTIPSSFNGNIGGANVARPPWGWYSVDRRDDPPGLWFFDPAKTVKRDYNLPDSFSTAYLSLPFWAVK